VPIIEPEYNGYIGMQGQIEYVRDKFGEKRNLLLLDNNVLASEKFDKLLMKSKHLDLIKKQNSLNLTSMK
jgi:hypothetical protein